MKRAPYLLGCSALVMLLLACEKKTFPPVPVDPNTPVSYTTDIQPMWNKSCIGSGCHDGSIPPNLTADKSYSALVDGGMVDTLKPKESTLMIKLNSNMPPSGKLSAADINKVEAWITQGAKQN
ncbi:MAG TPA: hypothetical protein PLQ93_04715 [Bacteroidia bacterium]|nr:hypothetical protein [Bacteroidia bacterium]